MVSVRRMRRFQPDHWQLGQANRHLRAKSATSADTTGIGALRNRLDPHFGQPVMCFEAMTLSYCEYQLGRDRSRHGHCARKIRVVRVEQAIRTDTDIVFT